MVQWVKTQCFHNRDPGLIPDWGPRILQSRKLSQKEKKKKSGFGGLKLKDDKSVIREGSRDWKERVGVQKGAGAGCGGGTEGYFLFSR